jgi:hypothetical protein
MSEILTILTLEKVTEQIEIEEKTLPRLSEIVMRRELRVRIVPA